MAQRLANIAAPGSLLKQHGVGKPKKGAAAKKARELDAPHLEAIRQCPCLKCGKDPAGEAAHVRMSSGAHGKTSSLGARPDDKWALPLCHEHHMAQHRVGELPFWDELGINPMLICQSLYRVSPSTEAMRATVFAAQAIGGKA